MQNNPNNTNNLNFNITNNLRLYSVTSTTCPLGRRRGLLHGKESLAEFKHLVKFN